MPNDIHFEPHYNTHFGVHSDIRLSVITEQPYNEGLIHRKYKQWEPVGCYKQMSNKKEGVIMRLQCILNIKSSRPKISI